MLLKLSILCTSLLLGPLALSAPVVNKPAPDFSLLGHDGKTHKLSDQKGKYVVLEWWNKDCPFVVKHYNTGNMQGLQAEFAEKGVVWYTVLSSAPKKQGHLPADGIKQAMGQVNGKQAAVLMDEDGKVGQLYAAKTTPHMYIINPEGTLIYMGAIDDKPTANEKDVEGAKNFVKLALGQSMSGSQVEVASTKPYGCSVKY